MQTITSSGSRVHLQIAHLLGSGIVVFSTDPEPIGNSYRTFLICLQRLLGKPIEDVHICVWYMKESSIIVHGQCRCA